MKVICIYWTGIFFKVGEVYGITDTGRVYNPKSDYTTADVWYNYPKQFTVATPLMEALA
jgi:hypothetical protein